MDKPGDTAAAGCDQWTSNVCVHPVALRVKSTQKAQYAEGVNKGLKAQRGKGLAPGHRSDRV